MLEKNSKYLGCIESKKTGKFYAVVLVEEAEGVPQLSTTMVECKERPKFKVYDNVKVHVVDIKYNKPVYGF